jgi:alpha-glucosidase
MRLRPTSLVLGPAPALAAGRPALEPRHGGAGSERQPDALDFLKVVPTTWDETTGLDGRIGEWALVARRKGSEWWVAAMTEWDRRAVEVPLTFLDGDPWEASIWPDGANADEVGTDYRRTVHELPGSATLRLDLAPGGGAAVRLRHR